MSHDRWVMTGMAGNPLGLPLRAPPRAIPVEPSQSSYPGRLDRCPSQGECTHETSLSPVFQPRPCPTPLYISAWLVELRLGVRNPWAARGTDAHQLGLGPKALYGVVMVPDVSREGKRLCPHVSPNGHIASAVPSDEALAIRSDQSSPPLLRGAIGGARDALPGNAYPWERGRLPSATLPGCHL